MKAGLSLRKLSHNESGVSLPELLIGIGISAVVSLGAYQLIENSGKLTKKVVNETELSDSRQIITKILNNRDLCTLNFEGRKTGDQLQRLILAKDSNKVLSVLEVNKKLNLTAATPGLNNEKYYLKDMRIINFSQISKPITEEINSTPTSLTQGILQLEVTFARDNSKDSGSIVTATFSEVYNTNAMIRTNDGKIYSCSSGIHSVEDQFCETSLRGKNQSDVCHSIKIAPKVEEGPSVTLLKPNAPEKFSLTSKDGMLIGDYDQPIVNLGAHSRNYLEKFHFFAEKIKYKPDGSIDKVLERHEAYFIVTYTKSPTGSKVAPAPYNFRYNYNVYQKSVVIKDNISTWTPAASSNNVLLNWDYTDSAIWKPALDFGKSWFVSIQSSANPMVHGQIPSHNSALQILNSQEGSIYAVNVTANQVNTEGGQYFAYDYKYASDRRLKSNIHTVVNTDDISKIHSYRYSFRSDPKTKHFGFMADEVTEIYPEAVSTGNDGYEKVDYLSLLSPIIQNLKKQNHDLNQIRKDIEELRRNP